MKAYTLNYYAKDMTTKRVVADTQRVIFAHDEEEAQKLGFEDMKEIDNYVNGDCLIYWVTLCRGEWVSYSAENCVFVYRDCM